MDRPFHSARVAACMCVAGWVCFAPSVAFAGGGAVPVGQTRDVVVLFSILAVAYLLVNFVVERLQRKMLFVSGFEYLLLGVPLGLMSARFFTDFDALLPIIALATGWFGLLRGMELGALEFRNAPSGSFEVAMLDDLGAGLAVGLGSYLVFITGVFGQFSGLEAAVTAGALGCCAAAGSTRPIDVLKRRYHVEGQTIPVLRRAARLGDVAAVLVFGFIFAWFHPDSTGDGTMLSSLIWSLVTVAGGLALGVLFTVFLGGDESEKARLLALVGVITFTSGAAYMLRLAPLAVNLVLGAVLVNRAKRGHAIRLTLERTERPMSLVLYIFAGAIWGRYVYPETIAPSPSLVGSILLLSVGLVVTRLVGKALSGSLVAFSSKFTGRHLFLGLVGQGDIAVAMAVSFRLIYPGSTLVDVAYTAILVAVVFEDIIAPRLLRGLLMDAGEILREQEA